MIATMLLVCLTSCADPSGSDAIVGAGVVLNRIVVDSSIQAGRSAFVPPPRTELKPDDGTPIGGATAP